VLNPGGVRIGTAEIYRQVEQLDEVFESIVIGQEWEGDVRVVLFVKLKEGLSLDEGLAARSSSVSARTRRRDMCRRRSCRWPTSRAPRAARFVELAVRDVVHGRPVKNVEALANPEALEHFRNLPLLSAA
jgi:acetoacetyl-CoA synthetase